MAKVLFLSITLCMYLIFISSSCPRLGYCIALLLQLRKLDLSSVWVCDLHKEHWMTKWPQFFLKPRNFCYCKCKSLRDQLVLPDNFMTFRALSKFSVLRNYYTFCSGKRDWDQCWAPTKEFGNWLEPKNDEQQWVTCTFCLNMVLLCACIHAEMFFRLLPLAWIFFQFERMFCIIIFFFGFFFCNFNPKDCNMGSWPILLKDFGLNFFLGI